MADNALVFVPSVKQPWYRNAPAVETTTGPDGVLEECGGVSEAVGDTDMVANNEEEYPD